MYLTLAKTGDNISACRAIAKAEWGDIQHQHKIRKGVYEFSTSGHGGFVVDGWNFDVSKIPDAFFFDCTKKFAAFEEDCAWSVLLWYYPEVSKAFYRKAKKTHSPAFFEKYPTHEDWQKSVKETVERWYPELKIE